MSEIAICIELAISMHYVSALVIIALLFDLHEIAKNPTNIYLWIYGQINNPSLWLSFVASISKWAPIRLYVACIANLEGGVYVAWIETQLSYC